MAAVPRLRLFDGGCAAVGICLMAATPRLECYEHNSEF